MTFELGDRVRINPMLESGGKTGVITETINRDLYRVEFTDGSDSIYNRVWLSLDPVKVFKMSTPPEPEGVDRVRSVLHPQVEWQRQDGLWYRQKDAVHYQHSALPWHELVRRYPDGLELIPEKTAYERAIEWFKEDPERMYELDRIDNRSAAIRIIKKVLEDG